MKRRLRQRTAYHNIGKLHFADASLHLASLLTTWLRQAGDVDFARRSRRAKDGRRVPSEAANLMHRLRRVLLIRRLRREPQNLALLGFGNPCRRHLPRWGRQSKRKTAYRDVAKPKLYEKNPEQTYILLPPSGREVVFRRLAGGKPEGACGTNDLLFL